MKLNTTVHKEMEGVKNLAQEWGRNFGKVPVAIESLPGAGSSRRYFRVRFTDNPADTSDRNGKLFPGKSLNELMPGNTLIATVGDSERENKSFIELDRCFTARNLPVPVVVAHSEDYHYYLQQDLGNESLFGIIREEKGIPYIEESMRLLPEIQLIPDSEWQSLVFNRPFTGREILNDLHYFRNCFLREIGIETEDSLIEQEFDDICRRIDEIPEQYIGLMLRDCQSRNVMVFENKPHVIDFQGARRGPILYDAVSFLWQAKAQLDAGTRRRGLEIYAGECKRINPSCEPTELLKHAPLIVLIRTLQVLGAYGLRGLIERKPHFLQSIPQGINNLVELFDNPMKTGLPCGWEENPRDIWPELTRITKILKNLPIVREINSQMEYLNKESRINKEENTNQGGQLITKPRLKVNIFSFSYKKGYPIDYSGNGGGFMFDCRGLHNPGRYDEYKSLTGRDSEVIEYLESYHEVNDFIEDCSNLCKRSIERYLERGFTSLQIGFGCTGGQHRSVYCAERMGKILHSLYPEIDIMVTHKEQMISYRYPVCGCEKKSGFKSLILAAGLGTRLRPWTLEHPKALVPVAGEPMLRRVAAKLLESGSKRIGINVCHFSAQLNSYVEEDPSFTELLNKYGAQVIISDETGNLLETGGGIVKIAPLLDPEDEGFLVHNVDILSNADLGKFIELHQNLNPAGVTLLTSDRDSSRKLIFSKGELLGWENRITGDKREVNPEKSKPHKIPETASHAEYGLNMEPADGAEAFSGIYVIGKGVANEMSHISGEGAFSITEYLLNPNRRHPVFGIRQKDLKLIDIGKPDALNRANEDIKNFY